MRAHLVAPKLAPHALFSYLDGEGFFAVTEHQTDVLFGEVFRALPPLLTGELSIDEILDRTAEQFPELEVLFAIELLQKCGCLVEGASEQRHAAYWAARSPMASRAKVSVVSHSSQDAAELRALLGAQGVDVAIDDSDTDALRAVLVDDYADPVLSEQNTAALATGAPWMLVKPTGNILWFGPIFVPGKTGCWACLTHRLQLNRRALRFIERKTRSQARYPLVTAPILSALASSIAASEIVQWLCRGPSTLEGVLRTLDTTTHNQGDHILTRRPQCPVCGTPANLTAPGPVVIAEANADPSSRDGGFRSRTAMTVFESLKAHVSPVLGVVNHLIRLDSGDDDIHVYVSGENIAATGGTLRLLTKSIRSRSSGKGISEIQAKTSALCEALERYAAVFQGNEPHKLASVAELGDDAIHPNSCMLFSETQYARRDSTNIGADGYTRVPNPVRVEEPMWWSPVWSLGSNRQKYCPTAYLYFHSDALQDPHGLTTCLPDSNGVAAGSTYPETILQGLLELIERDAVALWWYPRAMVPRVDIESFRSDFLARCFGHHQRLGRELWALDVTSDLGIPTFAGISRRRTGEQQIVLGFGAHPDARIALERAMAETNQLLTGMQTRACSREGHSGATADWFRTATIESEYYLAGRSDAETSATTYSNVPGSVSEALRSCVTSIRDAGHEIYYHDFTRSDIDLKVMRVLVPGLRHFWRRYAPGRLYNARPAGALSAAPKSEEDLNPIAMFL